MVTTITGTDAAETLTLSGDNAYVVDAMGGGANRYFW